MNDEMIVIDTADGMAHFRICQHISMLRTEIKTGLRHSRGSVMNSARQLYGSQKRTKAGVLADLEKLYELTYGWPYGSKR